MTILILGVTIGGWPPSALAAGLPARDFVVIESENGSEPCVVAGNPGLLDTPACPASTFKIVLAWAALDRGVIATDTRLPCLDPHLGSATHHLDLSQALLYSSNAFFQTIAPRVGRPALEAFLRESGYLPPSALKGWLGKDWSPVVKGGRLRISPRQQHAFLVRFLKDEIAVGRTTRPALLEALRWPTPNHGLAATLPIPSSPSQSKSSGVSPTGDGQATTLPPLSIPASPSLSHHEPPDRKNTGADGAAPALTDAWELAGKTGAAGGVVWFTGFGRRAGRWRAVTVFCRGPVARRPAVIAAFYERFGLRWDPALLPPLP